MSRIAVNRGIETFKATGPFLVKVVGHSTIRRSGQLKNEAM